jgi:hypothetical protein
MTHDTPHPDPETIDAYVAAGMLDAERSAVDAHLAVCPACTAIVEQATTADRAMLGALASAGPADGFDDRLVTAVRAAATPRMRLSPPVRRAAIAAAAVLVVGTFGYVGSVHINGGAQRLASNARSKSNLHQMGLAIVLYGNGQDGDYGRSTETVRDLDDLKKKAGEPWDYGGGSATASNWAKWGPVSTKSPFDGQDSVLLPVAAAKDDKSETPQDTTVTTSPALQLSSPAVTTVSRGASPESLNFSYYSAGKQNGKLVRTAGNPSYRDQFAPPTDGRKVATKLDVQRIDSEAVSKFDAGVRNGPSLNVTGSSDLPTGKNAQIEALSERLGRRRVELATVNGASVATGFPGAADKVSADDIAIVSADPDYSRATSAGNVELHEAGQTTAATSQPAVDTRKIIRTGTMEFEVDRFDSAQATINKIVGEAGGFVGTTESQKLPNGKTRGTITLRVAPERLDTLVLSLRALGDLKSQQISAADITKEYTDLESELAADRAMQDRLLDLIKTGKGSIKDLLAAETELGTWRTKIEKAEGEIRYFNGQISLSTLTITLSERDIQTPASAYEIETADMGIETDDVEKARDSALKAVDDVKGRVIQADLKRLDAGQLAATLTLEVPPEAAGATIDRMKQLGRVARLEVNRQTANSDGSAINTAAANAPVKIDKRPTRLMVSIYNLAIIPPRQTTTVTLIADDVETAYAAVTAAGNENGRVVDSTLNRGDPATATGDVRLDVPPAKLEATMAAIRKQGEVMKLSVLENPDTANTSDAKRGVSITIRSLASVAPRESDGIGVAVVDVRTAYGTVLSAAADAKARVFAAKLNEQDHQTVSGTIEMDVLRSQWPALQTALAGTGDIVARTADRSTDVENTTDVKIRIGLTLTAADKLPARETTTMQIEVADVDKAAADVQAMAVAGRGRVTGSQMADDHGKGVARVSLDVPLTSGPDLVRQLRSMGTVRGIDSNRNPQAAAGTLAHAVVQVEFVTADAIVADTGGPWASVKHGLATSVTGLMWSLQWIVVGLCLIVPWAVIAWVGWKLWKRRSRRASAV